MKDEQCFEFMVLNIFRIPRRDSYDRRWGFILLYRWNNPVYSFFNIMLGHTVWSLFSITAEWPKTLTLDLLSFGTMNLLSIGRHTGDFWFSFLDYWYHAGKWHREGDEL